MDNANSKASYHSIRQDKFQKHQIASRRQHKFQTYHIAPKDVPIRKPLEIPTSRSHRTRICKTHH